MSLKKWQMIKHQIQEPAICFCIQYYILDWMPSATTKSPLWLVSKMKFSKYLFSPHIDHARNEKEENGMLHLEDLRNFLPLRRSKIVSNCLVVTLIPPRLPDTSLSIVMASLLSPLLAPLSSLGPHKSGDQYNMIKMYIWIILLVQD